MTLTVCNDKIAPKKTRICAAEAAQIALFQCLNAEIPDKLCPLIND